MISKKEVLLFERAERHFVALRGVEPPIYESLLAPWDVNGEPVGTLWANGHTPDRHFDAEDARLLASLARFAAVAWQTVTAIDQAERERQEIDRQIEERTSALAER